MALRAKAKKGKGFETHRALQFPKAFVILYE